MPVAVAAALPQPSSNPAPRAPTPGGREQLVYQLPLLKGACILAVVVTHVVTEFMKMTHWDGLAATMLVVHSLARFAVPTFVALSGFYLSLNRRNERARPFYRRTLKHLLIPYVAYSLVYSLPDLLTSAGPGRLVWNLCTASAWGHLWFMALIIQLYVAHPFLSRWYRRCERRGRVVLVVLLVQIAYSAALTWLPATESLAGAPRLGVRLARLCLLSNLGYFLCGYYLLEHADAALRLVRRPAVAALGGVLWLAVALAEAAYWAVPLARGLAFRAITHAYLLHSLLTPLLTAAALLTLVPVFIRRGPRASPIHRLLSSLGLFSFGVYCLHPLTLGLGQRTLASWASVGPDDWTYYLVLFPTALFVTLAAVRLAAAGRTLEVLGRVRARLAALGRGASRRGALARAGGTLADAD
jgi:surface polysaccharide O-acyltransferase-like enzyme